MSEVTIDNGEQITVTGLDANADSPWFKLQGDYEVELYGTWDTANLDLETRIPGTGGTVRNVRDANFVAAVADVSVILRAGFGEYRFELSSVGGTTDLVAHFRRISR